MSDASDLQRIFGNQAQAGFTTEAAVAAVAVVGTAAAVVAAVDIAVAGTAAEAVPSAGRAAGTGDMTEPAADRAAGREDTKPQANADIETGNSIMESEGEQQMDEQGQRAATYQCVPAIQNLFLYRHIGQTKSVVPVNEHHRNSSDYQCGYFLEPDPS